MEDFGSDLLKDPGKTSANWNTTSKDLRLVTSGGAFYEVDEKTIGATNVSSDAAQSTIAFRDIVLDSNDFPHIAWADRTGTGSDNVFYSRWDGTKWTGQDSSDGISTHDIVTSDLLINTPSDLELDANEVPYITWQQGSGFSEVFFARWDATTNSWNGLDGTLGPDNVSSTGGANSNTPAMALESDGTPHLTWSEGPAGTEELLHAYWDGSSWAGLTGAAPDNISSAPGLSDVHAEVQIDSGDAPHISWAQAVDIVYTRWTGTAFTPTENASSTATLSRAPSLALDSDDQPNISWFESASGFPPSTVISFSRKDKTTGTWVKADRSVATAGADNVSLAIGLAGAGFSQFASLALDRQDNPTIAYADDRVTVGPSYETIFTRWNGSGWTQPDRTTSGYLKVHSNATFDFATNHVLDSYDNPSIAWYGTGGFAGSGEVFYTRWIEPCTSPAVAQSLTVDAAGEPILNATLTVDEQLLGGSTTWFLSNNGGNTFEEVTPGTSHTFSGAGSDLRWKAELTGGTTFAACPIVNELSIDYSTNPVGTIFGDDPAELAINVSRQSFGDGEAPVVVLARKELMVDAFDSIPLVSLTGASLLLTAPDSLDAATLTEIQRILPTGGKIYILGETEAISTDVVSSLTANGFADIERLGGLRRFETAIEIYKEIMDLNPSGTDKAVLAEADFLVDALGVGHAAGDLTVNSGTVRPILLTNRESPDLYPATHDFLSQVQAELVELELVGGTTAISLGVQNVINQDFPNVATPRLNGQTRYDTNRLVNEKYFLSPTEAVIANGEGPRIPGSVATNSVSESVSGSGLFTALLGGSFATRLGSPLVLTQAATLPGPSEVYLVEQAHTLESAIAIGNELDVSSAVKSLIGGIIK